MGEPGCGTELRRVESKRSNITVNIDVASAADEGGYWSHPYEYTRRRRSSLESGAGTTTVIQMMMHNNLNSTKYSLAFGLSVCIIHYVFKQAWALNTQQE